MDKFQRLIESLPTPTIFEEVKVEEIVKQHISIVKTLKPDIELIESDSNMLQIEAFAYREMLLINMFNSAIKKMLPHYSKGTDLDNFIFGFYGGEKRLKGVEPTAPYKFELEEVLSVDINIPKGLQLSNGQKTVSYLNENITIKAAELSAVGVVKLDLKVEQSDIRTEVVISPFPYVVKVTSSENFTGGTNPENDEAFFQRAILGLYQYSTAGGKKAYEYFAKSADSRVYDVAILNPSPRHIDVVVLSFMDKEEVKKAVNDTLNDEKIQAFDDVVTVKIAKNKTITIDAEIHLFDLLNQTEIDKKIKENFNEKFKIGESLPYSNIISKMHIGGVYKVVLENNEDITLGVDEYLDLTLNITYIGANL